MASHRIIFIVGLIAAAPAFGQQQFLVPEDSGVVDVTQPPYNAKGDGRTDDTAAIQQALDDHPNFNGIIYLPDGVYVISDTLEWPAGKHGGVRHKRVILQGQSTQGTVIRIKDNASGFGNARKPKSLIWTGERPAQRFRNGIRTLTVNVGRSNPGAIGVQYIANNQGSMRNVRIVSEDGAGRIGLDLGYTNEQGPCLIKDVYVRGFDVGIRTKFAVDSVTMENVMVEGQNEVGLRNEGQCVSILKFSSANKVPGIENLKSASLLTLHDGEFHGMAGNGTAVVNTGAMVLRHSKMRGYETFVDNSGSPGDQPSVGRRNRVEEWTSHEVKTLFDTEKKTLGLPIEPTPTAYDIPLSKWAGPHQFGGDGTDKADDTAAVQKAIDSGAEVIYFPHAGGWRIDGTVLVRGNVRRITALEDKLRGGGKFKVVDGGPATVIVERADLLYQGLGIEHASGRTLVISGITFGKGRYKAASGAGDLFLEDVCGHGWHFKNQNIWARQLNPENPSLKVSNDGGMLWILGLKTEQTGTLAKTTHGGRTEVFGGFCYANSGDVKPAMFIIDGSSSLSASIGEMVIRNEPYRTVVRQTRGGQTRELNMDALPGRGGGSMLTLFVGRSW